MPFTITRLGHQGDGIADGPIYAARTLPDEVVEGEVIGDRINTPKILEPSINRVSPPCRHYKSCGGCSLQHASDDFVSKWKQDIVTTALGAQGIKATIRNTIVSPSSSRIRATFSGRKTKKGSLVGFHGKAANAILEVPDCKILHPDLIAAIPAIQAITDIGASRKSEIKVTVTRSNAGLDVSVSSAKELESALLITLSTLAAKFGLARLTWNSELVVERNKPLQLFGTAFVNPPAGAFLQATEEGKIALVTAVLDAIQGAGFVIDLFSGSGTFSLPAAKTSCVLAVEGEKEMLRALDDGWRKATNLKNVTTETRDLFRRPLLASELGKADAIIIDPPRAGASHQFDHIAQSKVRKIASVSCNPVSFARDAKFLVDAGYALDWVDVVDQFRWSNHIEIVASFTRT